MRLVHRFDVIVRAWWFLAVVLWMFSGGAVAQSQATSMRTAAPVTLSESSITVQQIVARQEAHYRTIKTAKGTVVWQERQLSSGAQTGGIAPTRYIYFALGPDRSVTLVLPQDEARSYAANGGHPNWKKVLSAALVAGDSVQVISHPTSGTQPEVHAVPFNPAVHENNPLVAFHPRQLADERVALRELVALSSNMPTKPRVSEFRQGGANRLRIDFLNANAPGETLYYVINPDRGYLPIEIGRLSQGRLLSRSLITIGNTPDKTWIPARRETARFDTAGRQVSTESWYYEYLSVNEKLEPQTLSLLYFGLPNGTKVFGLPDQLRKNAAGPTPVSQAAQRSPATGVPVKAATPTPGARRYY